MGRDKNRVFIVIGTSDDGASRLIISDGRLRRVDKPKTKNPSHVTVLGRLTEDEKNLIRISPDNGKIRRIIAKYDDRYRPDGGVNAEG